MNKAMFIYESVINLHPEWRREFETWFTMFLLCDGKSEDDAAVLAAGHCADWLGKRRIWNQPVDPLIKRQKEGKKRSRRSLSPLQKRSDAFKNTHKEFMSVFGVTPLTWKVSVTSNSCDSYFEDSFTASTKEAEEYFFKRFDEECCRYEDNLRAFVFHDKDWWVYELICFG